MSSARCSCSPRASGRRASGSSSCRARYRCTERPRETRPSSPRTCPPRAQPRTGFGKDSLEIESYVRGLARRRPDVVVTTLRLANLMGAGVDSQVTRYLSLPVVPRVMGFDARLQFLHPSDAVDALLLVTRPRCAGDLQRRGARCRNALPSGPQDGPADRWRPKGRSAVGCHTGTPGTAGRLHRRPDRRTHVRSWHGHVPFHVPRQDSSQGSPAVAALQEFVGVSGQGLLSPEAG